MSTISNQSGAGVVSHQTQTVVTAAQLQSCQRIIFRLEVIDETFVPLEMRNLVPAKELPKLQGQKGELLLKWTESTSADIAAIFDKLILGSKTQFNYARVLVQDNPIESYRDAKVLRLSLKREADAVEDANYTGLQAVEMAKTLSQLQGRMSIHLNPDPNPRGAHNKMLIITIRVQRRSLELSRRMLRMSAENGDLVIE